MSRFAEKNASIIERTTKILDAADETGGRWFSQRWMARKVGLPDNTTGRYLDRLTAIGRLERWGDSAKFRLSRERLKKQAKEGLKLIEASKKGR